MAKKKEDTQKKVKDPEKEAKRKARMEALKNRPAEQRPNSKQIDIIKLDEDGKKVVKNFGYAIKNKDGYQGVLVTSVLEVEGTPVNTSVAFVPGNLTVKAKKGHGTICAPKNKKAKDDEEDDSSEE